MKGNLKIQVNAFLQDTFNVFSLSKKNGERDARNSIMIDIIPGKSYIENSEASIIHAGESPYREFEGILPVLQKEDEEWGISKYGPTLYNKLKYYFEDDSLAAQDELWSTDTSYKTYTNEYKITTNWYMQPYTGTENYLSYGGMEETLTDKDFTSYALGSIDGDGNDGLYANIKLIHFSKYYNIYLSKRGLAPLLHSLIYDYDSLTSYNMDIEEGTPYINTLITYRAYRGGFASNVTEETLRMYIRKVYYNREEENYPYDYYNDSSEECNNKFEDDGPVSQFKTNRNRYPTYYEGMDEEWDNYVPQGFSLFGITDESHVEMVFNDSNGHDISLRSEKLPSTWRANFKCLEDYRYSFDLQNYHYVAHSETTQTILGLIYKGDEAGNAHILNNYFVCPVNPVLNQYISDRIMAADDKKLPATIGLAVASVLANIYVYSGMDTLDIKYVSDIIYLAPNDTLYTKDMVYKAYISLAANVSHNNVLNFKGIDYSQYLDLVKTRVFGNTNTADKLHDNNVNAIIKGCIKNHPLLVKLQYQDPNLDNLNRADSVVAVKGVDGKVQSIVFDGLLSDIMYLVQDTADGIAILELGKSFQIRYLKKLELNQEDNRTLIPTWDDEIPSEVAPDLIKAFKVANDKLICSEWRSKGAKSSYYSIVGDYYTHSSVSLVDLLKDDVLIPFAKLWR